MPFVECSDGTCASTCASALPRRRRDLVIEDQAAKCPKGFDLCGVFNGKGDSWECLDTRSDLESCEFCPPSRILWLCLTQNLDVGGGCTVPILGMKATGMDCTSITGVENVSCVSGRCVISSCQADYFLSEDRAACISSLSSYIDDDDTF